MKTLHIAISDKIATYQKRDGDIVCGNSDYQIKFAFDSEWDAYSEKVARFIWGGLPPVDVPFTGDTCVVPVIENTTSLKIGVYAGDKVGVDTWELNTSTPAIIGCLASILCGDDGNSRVVEKEYKKSFVSNTFANALKGSASGEAVLLDDVSPVEHDVGVKVSSKNLLQLHDAGHSVTKGGITFTWLEGGQVRVNGTATEDVEVHVNKVKYTLKGGVKYFISGCPSGGSNSTYYLHFRGYDLDYGSGRLIGGLSDFTNDVDIMVKSGVTVNNLIFSPMLELGTTGTAFAPHIDDLSAVKVSRYGKNLCDRTKFKPFGSGTITLIDNGLIYTGSYYMTLDVSFVQIGVPYRVSWKYKTSDSITPIYRILYEDGSYSSTLANGNGFTPTKAVKSILIYPEMTSTIHTTTFTDIQIEIGNAPTEYELYTAPVEYPVNSDGSVDGVRSTYPSMTMLTDTAGAVVECNYNRDLNKAIEELCAAIISLGGNV